MSSRSASCSDTGTVTSGTKAFVSSEEPPAPPLGIQLSFSWQFLPLCLHRLRTENSKEHEPTRQKKGELGAVMGPNRPGATQTAATSGGGGSDGDLLVLSEEGPLVGAADVLEDPVHLLVLRLVGRGDQWAAAAAVGLLRVLHHLPEEQLLHLGQKGAVRRREEEEQPWRCPAATHRGDSTERSYGHVQPGHQARIPQATSS